MFRPGGGSRKNGSLPKKATPGLENLGRQIANWRRTARRNCIGKEKAAREKLAIPDEPAGRDRNRDCGAQPKTTALMFFFTVGKWPLVHGRTTWWVASVEGVSHAPEIGFDSGAEQRQRPWVREELVDGQWGDW